MKVGILGSDGMLGTELLAVCRQKGLEVTGYRLPAWDITRSEDVERAVEASDVVVNCAAFTDVDGAESRREQAFAVNAEAAGRLGEIAARRGTRVIHISTDFVFDGRQERPYTEADPPNPINVYGMSKLEGERLLAESGCELCILRVEWTYGRYGSNFVTKILDRARSIQNARDADTPPERGRLSAAAAVDEGVNAARAGETAAKDTAEAAAGAGEAVVKVAAEAGRQKKQKISGPLRVVDDQIGSPTSIVDVSLVICSLIVNPRGRAGRLYHYAAGGFASRYEAARFILEKKGVDVPVVACKTDDFPAPARRPLSSRFDCGLIQKDLGLSIRPWQEPLAEFLETL